MIRRAGVICPGEKKDSMPDSMMDGLSLGELGPTTFICGARAISMGGKSFFQINIKMEAAIANTAPARKYGSMEGASFARSI